MIPINSHDISRSRILGSLVTFLLEALAFPNFRFVFGHLARDDLHFALELYEYQHLPESKYTKLTLSMNPTFLPDEFELERRWPLPVLSVVELAVGDSSDVFLAAEADEGGVVSFGGVGGGAVVATFEVS